MFIIPRNALDHQPEKVTVSQKNLYIFKLKLARFVITEFLALSGFQYESFKHVPKFIKIVQSLKIKHIPN